jgi:ketosteroid isomerase-like protein
MKRLYFSLVSLLMVFLISISCFANEPAQKDEIEKTINNYVTSTDSRDVNSLEKTLYSDARLVTVNKITNKTSAQTSGQLVELVKTGRAGGWKRNLEVSSVDGNDNVATAKVSISDPSVKQTGYMSLVKDGDSWKIVSGVFTLESNK